MNRQEFATKVQDLVNQAYLGGIDKKYYKNLIYEAEELRYPITLAEFLGWEVNKEYIIDGELHYLTNVNDLLWYDENLKKWVTCTDPWDKESIRTLQNAKKIEDKKYYAKIKGWQLIPSEYYYFGLNDNHDLEIKDACDAYEFTKREWADLGITDENADFEEVE